MSLNTRVLFIVLLLFANTVATAAQLDASNASLSVPAAGNTPLLDLDVRGVERIYVQVTPTTNGFDAFTIAIKPQANGAYSTIASVAADYTSPSGLLVGASGDLTTLAAATTGWFILDVRGIFMVRVQASGSGGASTVSIYAGGF